MLRLVPALLPLLASGAVFPAAKVTDDSTDMVILPARGPAPKGCWAAE